jgi:predicted N-acetyltransferase YhbS
MISYRLAKPQDITAIARLYQQSFKEYPLFDLMVDGDKHSGQDFLYQLHLINTKAYYRRHCCLVAVEGDTVVAAALLKHRSRTDIRFWDYVLNGGSRLLISGGISRIVNVLRVMAEVKDAVADLKSPYWYLETFAVAPEAQSQRLGSRMISECILPYIAEHGGGDFALVTNTDANRRFYTKCGFVEFGASVIRRGGQEVGNWSFITTVQ